ncbi:hypothetical protein FB451DRAFT_1215035 [Mycena latifolia]|nr:hypothetical protein FB451DRAFT_1215035 [Mycena latifolia]
MPGEGVQDMELTCESRSSCHKCRRTHQTRRRARLQRVPRPCEHLEMRTHERWGMMFVGTMYQMLPATCTVRAGAEECRVSFRRGPTGERRRHVGARPHAFLHLGDRQPRLGYAVAVDETRPGRGTTDSAANAKCPVNAPTSLHLRHGGASHSD